MKVIEYKLVDETSAKALQGAVNTYIENGWQLYGNVAVACLGGYTSMGVRPVWAYCQVMVKYEEKQKGKLYGKNI